MKNLALDLENESFVMFFDDGLQVRRKIGKITDIKDGLIYFSEGGIVQLIPIFRVIRIVCEE